ncbi:MAG: pantoate--beta-alanine ligase [Legionellales bacterium]|nr:pantoate--beta-alanine ligase [Legionellales bacterium]
MHIISDPQQLISYLQQQTHLSLGFVPTMGNLHAGHLRLITTARQHCDRVIVSIFVNPLQFNNPEDLKNYPRTLIDDEKLLNQVNCDILFYPHVDTIYPHGLNEHTQVFVPNLSNLHCGEFRPGHFQGVTTIVCKLFNLIQPDYAFFGEKDFQQLTIIRHMVNDLCIPVKIVSVPTVREADGLAMSSRNQYLTPRERALAPNLYRVLSMLSEKISQGNNHFTQLVENAYTELKKYQFQPEYIHICNAHTLLPAKTVNDDLVILAAAYLGKARLIDNLCIMGTHRD